MAKNEYNSYFTIMALTLDQIQYVCDNPTNDIEDLSLIRDILGVSNKTSDILFTALTKKEDKKDDSFRSVIDRMRPHDLN